MGDVETFGVNNPQVPRATSARTASASIDAVDAHLVVAEGGDLVEPAGAFEGVLNPLGSGGIGGAREVIAQH